MVIIDDVFFVDERTRNCLLCTTNNKKQSNSCGFLKPFLYKINQDTQANLNNMI